MTKRVVFTPEADDDILEAYRWYQTQEAGLGEEFLRCVGACLESIQRHPLMYRVAIDDFRRALIRRFPVEIFYEATDQQIVVYSVFHCALDPAKWQQRLRRSR